jgi:hypothetical protein
LLSLNEGQESDVAADGLFRTVADLTTVAAAVKKAR